MFLGQDLTESHKLGGPFNILTIGSLPGSLKDSIFLGCPCKAGYVTITDVEDVFGQLSQVGLISIF